MSTVATSTNGVPIVVERAMWWPAPGVQLAGGAQQPGRDRHRHAVGAGRRRVGRAERHADLRADRQHVDVRRHRRASTLLFEDGTTAEKLFTLPASSRTNVSVDVEFPAAVGRRFGALIETQGATPAQIVVERAMYSNANGVIWAAGTNALATRLQ